MVFAAALALGLVPFLTPLLPAVARYGAPEVRLFTAIFCAVCFCGALSLILGATTIGRDLSEGRLGFYFARPLPAGAIWGGKFLGVWSVVLGSAVLIVLPVGLADVKSPWRGGGGFSFGWGALAGAWAALFLAVAGAALFCLALGNVVSLSVRGKSGWMLGDLVLLVLYAAAVWLILVPLIEIAAWTLLTRAATGLAIGGSIALLASGLAQVAVGRTDSARGARARFVMLWGVLLLPVLGCLAYVRWLVTPSPGDLASAWVDCAAAKTDWVALGGYAPGRANITATFLYDLASGRSVRAALVRNSAIDVAADGTAAAWTRRALFGGESSREVWFCRLDAADLRPRRTPITGRFWNLRLSPGGARLAVEQDNRVAVYDLATGRLLSAAESLDEANNIRIVFRDADHLLIYRMTSPGRGEELRTATVTVSVLDIPARRLSTLARIDGVHRPFTLALDDRRQHVLVWDQEEEAVLWDAASGLRLASLGRLGPDAHHAVFLSDGRTAVAQASGGAGRLRLFSAQGQPDRVYELGPVGFVRIGAEPAPGKLTLAIDPAAQGFWGGANTYLLDLASGELRRIARHSMPTAALLHWRLSVMEPGSEVTRLVQRTGGAFLRLDPGTATAVPFSLKR